MKIFPLLIVTSAFLLSGCTTSKNAWEYYDECSVANPDFIKMAQCGKQNRMTACNAEGSCTARGNALVQYADSLVASVNAGDLTKAEATRQWLEYRRNEENAYRADMNAIYMQQAISAPRHTNCRNVGTYTNCTTY